MTGWSIARALGSRTSCALEQLRARAYRGSGQRRFGRGRLQSQLLARSAPRVHAVAPAARRRRDGPRDRLPRSQRQWRPRSRRAARERRADHDRPDRPSARPTPRASVTVGGLTPYMPIPVGIDATSLEDPMLAPQEGGAGRGAATGRSRRGPDRARRRRRYRRCADEERRARVSKASTSSWSIRAARSSRPRAPTSTASSCSTGSPTGNIRSGSARRRPPPPNRARSRACRRNHARTARSCGWARSRPTPVQRIAAADFAPATP